MRYVSYNNKLNIMSNVKEIWKEYKGYKVSNLGNVQGKYVAFLKPHISASGYIMFGAKLGNGHRLVWKAFYGETPKGLEIHHKNGIKTDNRLINLEMCTRSQNQKYNYENKVLNTSGEKNGMSELTEKEVLEIYDLIKKGESNDVISIKYNIHSRYVSLIRHGKRWKYLFKQHFTTSFKSLDNIGYNYRTIIKILKIISKGEKTNKEISEIFDLDRGSVCKIRNRKLWKDAWKYYDNLLIATTIPKGSTLQANGNGKAENLSIN